MKAIDFYKLENKYGDPIPCPSCENGELGVDRVVCLLSGTILDDGNASEAYCDECWYPNMLPKLTSGTYVNTFLNY